MLGFDEFFEKVLLVVFFKEIGVLFGLGFDNLI